MHFISGLPRSGSTLLAALLRQNPSLRAGTSGPLAVLCERVLPVLGQGEYAAGFDDRGRRRVLSALFDAVLEGVPADAVPFDTNRAWCAHLGLLADLAPNARIVACVRDPVWIIDSFEGLFRRNPYLVSKLHGLPASATVFDRVEQLMAVTGAFGAAWQALQDAFYGEHAHRLIVLDYDELVADPRRVLALLYDLLGLPAFAHDPDAVAPVGGDAFDAALNTPGLHAVRPRVQARHRRCVLPPAIVARLAGTAFWRDPAGNPGGAFVIAPA